ncbi:YetF domain-containing protein [Gymnodinialimonas sp. 57CJ19]|uniref:DUF421 domain-containing protein n=1 Tax=Gymnodinialimonas sp. 57CJ19 TaxID=3138498 RepID=UPI003134236A
MFFDSTTLDVLARAIILSIVGLAWVILVVRIIGLRTFSKMTAFDFVATVATGSLLAGAAQATGWSGFWQAVIAIAALLGTQFAIAKLRISDGSAIAFLQNAPVILMEDGIVNEAALSKTRVTRDDLFAKLREANVLDVTEVRAVVLETTGDISVLHGEKLNDDLLFGVTRIDAS